MLKSRFALLHHTVVMHVFTLLLETNTMSSMYRQINFPKINHSIYACTEYAQFHSFQFTKYLFWPWKRAIQKLDPNASTCSSLVMPAGAMNRLGQLSW